MAKFHVSRSEPKGTLDLLHWCPGCNCAHSIRIAGDGPRWTWNNDVEKPTVSPSINYYREVCHYFVREGKIEFLSDCTHKLAGQTVEIPDWETWPDA